MNNTIAIIGVAQGQKQLYLKARKAGIRTIGFGWPEGAVCNKLADVYCPISILDIDKITDICSQENVDGVVSNGSNLTAKVCASVSEILGLIGNPRSTIEHALDKFYVREVTSDITGLRQVKHQLLKDGDQVRIKPPCVVKPTGGGGKNGVSFVNSTTDFIDAIEYCENANTGDILLEEYISGQEISVESISYKGIHYVIQITDKQTTGAPHFVEIAHHQPSRLPDSVKEEITEIVKQILDRLEFQNGAAHIEMKVSEDGAIYLIEVNPRGGGGEISNQLVELSTGYDYVSAMLSVALDTFIPDEISKSKEEFHSGIYFLCEQTKALSHFIKESDEEPWFYHKEISDRPLNVSTGNGDRNGYMIYKSDHKIVP